MIATAAKLSKPVLTPLHIYLIIAVLLLLLVSAPFTIGLGVSRICASFIAFAQATSAWAAGSPLTSWMVSAALGFSLVSYGIALVMNDELVFKSARRGFLAVGMGIALAVTGEVLFLCLPTMNALYSAFGAAGGTPSWLNWLSAGIVVVFANALHGAVVLALLIAFVTTDFR
jgi:hypothetical protein